MTEVHHSAEKDRRHLSECALVEFPDTFTEEEECTCLEAFPDPS